MNLEDKPVAPNPDEVICPSCCHQFRAIPQNVQRLMLNAGFEPPFTQPVAAQESVAKVLGALMTSGRSDKYAMESYKPLEVGTLLYANAAPCARCARCAELEAQVKDWKRGANAEAREVDAAHAKITEQAALISELEARETILVRSNSSLNIQNKALEAEVSALKEWNATYEEAGKSFIERQRKVIEAAKTALETLMVPKGGNVYRTALDAIAELEKGVG